MLENAKLIILSEFNNYKYFLKQGIKPESFYTDLELFRKHSIFFNKVRILVVFGGGCNFLRKNVLKVIEALSERATQEDGDIADVTILSDIVLPTCKNYFKYNETPLCGFTAKNWNVSKKVGVFVERYGISRKPKLQIIFG